MTHATEESVNIPSSLHVTESELSIFSRDDFEVSSSSSSSSSSNSSNSNADDASVSPDDIEAKVAEQQQQLIESEEDDERKKLTRELLDALYLGTSNFLLAYNTRAGIGVLLRIFKLLQKRNFRGIFDLKVLLDEKNLSFRVEAVKLGLFLGWFTGGYRGLRALLPPVLKWFFNKSTRQVSLELQKQRIDELSAIGAGAISSCAIGVMDAKRRRTFALYALTRALQCAYNTAKRREYWHFWGSDWEYGDSLLFALSSAQVMYAYVMRPLTLPPEYFRFIHTTGPVESETLELVQQVNRKLPINKETLQKLITRKHITKGFVVPESGYADLIPCHLVHCDTESCTMGALQCFRRAFTKGYPLYLSLFIVPSVVIRFKRFLHKPFQTLGYAVLNATRSNIFLASFVTSYLSLICLHRRLVATDNRLVYYLCGLGASSAILLEPKSRRAELALYVLPRAIDSLFMILRDRKIFKGFANGEVALFSASMALMMYCYEHEKESVSPFLFSTMKRFLQTPTDKKLIYEALHSPRPKSGAKDEPKH